MKFIIEIPDKIIEQFYAPDEDDIRLDLNFSAAEAAKYDILEAIQYNCIMDVHEDQDTIKISIDETT